MKGGSGIEKFEFTYQDYLYFLNKTKENYDTLDKEMLCVAEESEEYKLENERIRDKKHDKIFKDILQNKKEMSEFLSRFLKQDIKQNELEIYSVNYITKDYKYKEADIVYKVKKEEIYYLVEHQTKVDYSMPYRVFNYCMEIIRSVVKDKKINSATYRYPIIIPIVLYTGNRKWTVSTSFADMQIETEDIDFKALEIKYKLIDVNKYEVGELLKEKTMLANAMILEKCKNNDETIYCLKKIIKNIEDKRQITELKRLIIYLYGKMEENNIEKILKLIEESESEEDMSTIAERLRKEYKNERKIGISLGLSQGISQGISQAVSQIIERMLKMNENEEYIQQVTGATKEQVEKIREQLKIK